jgi:hypothetical protein
VIEATPGGETISQSKLPLQDGNGSSAEFDPPILGGLRAVFVNAIYASLADTQDAVGSIVVGHDEGNFLGRRSPVKNRNSS